MPLLSLIVIYLLPLVPTFIIHNYIRNKTRAEIKIVQWGASLGGPAATYVILMFLLKSLLPSPGSTKQITVRLGAPPAKRDSLYAAIRKGALAIELQPANEKPIQAKAQTHAAGLNLDFDVPERLIGDNIPLVASGSPDVAFEPATVSVRLFSQVALIEPSPVPTKPASVQRSPAPVGAPGEPANLPTPGSVLMASVESLVGQYATTSPTSTRSSNGNACTTAPWQPTPEVAAPDVQVVIRANEPGELLLSLDGVGGAQLPRLPYPLRLTRREGNVLQFEAERSGAGWTAMCGAVPVTVPAFAAGRLTFVISKDQVRVTGNVNFTADWPKCGDGCATSFRDLFTVDQTLARRI